MSFHRLVAGALLAGLTFTTGVRAASIGINFNSGTAGGSLPATEPAGVVPQTNFNNTTGANPTTTGLLDNTGAATAAALAVAGVNGTWQYDPGGTPGNDALYTGYLDEFNPPGADSAKLTVTQIPYALYDVYVYSDSDNADQNRQGVYTIGGTTYYMGDTANFSGAFVRSNDTNPADGVTAGNYLRFENLSGSSFTLDAGVYVPGPARDDRGAMINGIQIVEVPEPGMLGGLLLAAAPLLLRRRQPA